MEKFKTKNISSIILSIIGLLVSIKLCLIYYKVNFTSSTTPSFCSINSFIDCDGAARTPYSQLLGVPLSLWGVLMYLFLLFIFYVPELKQSKYLKFLEVFKNPDSYAALLSILYSAGSLVMAGISLFVIHEICILCCVTYLINFILIFTTRTKNSIKQNVITAFNDFKDALKEPKYLISFALICILGAGALTYTTLSNKMTPQVVKMQEYKQILAYKKNDFKVSGNVLGDPKAKIIINEYTDYECPFCSISNSMFHKLVSELDNVLVIHHNYPLDRSCNPYLTVDIHQHSCMMSRYALAAKNQGKFWDMSSALFENQENITEARVIELARELGLNIDKLRSDAESEKIKQEIQTEILNAHKNKIQATPTFMIGLEKQEGVMTYEQLKEKIIKMGATPKEKK